MSPIVQVSEHHQPLNVSTTISVLPETSHVNVSGVVQESFNVSTTISVLPETSHVNVSGVVQE